MLQGKGFFIWQIQSCEKGNPDAIAAAAQAAGLTWVAVKIADGAPWGQTVPATWASGDWMHAAFQISI